MYYPGLVNFIWMGYRPLRNVVLRICIKNMLNFYVQKLGSVQSNALPVWASKNALNHMHQGSKIGAYHAHLFTAVGLVPFVRENASV